MSFDSVSPWVIRLRAADAGQLGPLRRITGLRILVEDSFVWLRGESSDSNISRRIRMIPDVECFSILPSGQLTRAGTTVPCARLPQGTWQSLQGWLKLELPTAGFAPPVANKVTLRLVRSASPTSANVLMTQWLTWCEYATLAPQIRLNRWAFALCDDQRVLIRGTPLPPIPGRRYAESEGIIVPNGWRFEPDVAARVAARVLKLDQSQMALFSEDGSFERVPRSAFVQATRSAVRATNGP